MAIPADCWRIVYKGRNLNGEVWQTGFWLQGNAPTSNATAQIAADLEMNAEATATASSFWNVFKAQIGPAITLDNVTVYSYPAGGTTAQFVGVSTHAPLVGTAASTYLPNQIAMCVSLLTGASGRSYRGRMFLPGQQQSYTLATGFWTAGAMSAIAGVLATKFTDFNAASGSGNVVVVSQKLTSALEVLAVRIDSRPDVQRRRANKTTGITTAVAAVTP